MWYDHMPQLWLVGAMLHARRSLRRRFRRRDDWAEPSTTKIEHMMFDFQSIATRSRGGQRLSACQDASCSFPSLPWLSFRVAGVRIQFGRHPRAQELTNLSIGVDQPAQREPAFVPERLAQFQRARRRIVCQHPYADIGIDVTVGKSPLILMGKPTRL